MRAITVTDGFLIAIALYSLSALVVFAGRTMAERASATLSVLGSVSGLAAAVATLVGGTTAIAMMPWHVPGGTVLLRIDSLAAVFLLVIFTIAGLGSIYGLAYWPVRKQPRTAARLRSFFALMTIGMALVVCAAQTIFFVVVWEVMAVAAFFLVATDDETPAVRRAAWVYLVATHAGTACLLAAFTFLHTLTGNYLLQAPPTSAGTSVVFILALIGFGLKAGIVPLHFWLPAAHASAPSHVSALMSGVMLKIGIYGIFRIAMLVAVPPLWWGTLLASLGALSAVLGIALAAAQSDLKRALAYSSIENIGIITLGLGLALTGRSMHEPLWVALGFGGSIYHVLSHGCFKSLLFLASGNVAHAAHTRDMDRLGGLLRRMPYTGNLFIVGALAASGVPLLNGFIGEWLIALGLLHTLQHASLLSFALPALALAAALALASFVRLTGTTFLGTARTTAAAEAHEAAPLMLAPMIVLAAACVVLGIWPTALAAILNNAQRAWLGRPGAAVDTYLQLPLSGLFVLAIAIALLTMVQALIVRRPARSITWDCGYARPTARMQYTSRSFGDWMTRLLPRFLAPSIEVTRPGGIFPVHAAVRTEAPDPFAARVYEPLVARFAARFERARRMQQGRLTLYLVYIFVTTLLALGWAYVRPSLW